MSGVLLATETIEYLCRVCANPQETMVRRSISEGIKAALSMPETWPTIRRYLVNTVFDSTFVMLGIIIGSAFSSEPNMRLIVVTILTSSVALGISTGVSTYEAENLEQNKRLDELERAMLRPLDDTHIGKSARSSMLLISFFIFLAPLLVGAVILSPFVLLNEDIVTAAWIAIALAIGILFTTGVFMGRSGRRNPWVQGARMAFIGAIAFVICFYIERMV
jgi:predicted membrane protein (TIGR00267 family)